MRFALSLVILFLTIYAIVVGMTGGDPRFEVLLLLLALTVTAFREFYNPR